MTKHLERDRETLRQAREYNQDAIEKERGWYDARREYEARELNINMAVDSFKFDPPDTPYQQGFLDYVRFMQIRKSRSHNPKFA